MLPLQQMNSTPNRLELVWFDSDTLELKMYLLASVLTRFLQQKLKVSQFCIDGMKVGSRMLNIACWEKEKYAYALMIHQLSTLQSLPFVCVFRT